MTYLSNSVIKMNLNFNPFPVLTTDRLVLRKLDLSDSEALLKLRSDESVNLYLDRPPTNTIADAEAFINKIASIVKNQQGIYWVINLKDEQELIGTVCFWNFNAEKKMADIGYELMPEYQGQGLMQEALAKVLSYAFGTMQLKAITGLVHPENESSIKALKRNGFVLDEHYEFVSKEDAGVEAVYLLTY